MKSIKIVVAVDRTYYKNLTGMHRVGRTTVVLPKDVVWDAVEIKSPCQLVISDKNEDNNTVFTAKLIIKTCNNFVDRKHYAYRCRLYDGHYRLIGSDERPFAMVSVNENMPERITDLQLNEVTISYSDNKYIPIIIP